MRAFLIEAKTFHPIELFALEVMRKSCRRCLESHPVWRDVYPDGSVDWTHGIEIVNGVGIPPEPCDAAVVHECLYEWRGEENE